MADGGGETGKIKTISYNQKYVESTTDSTKTTYAPFGDRQRAHYEYYVFDKTEFIDQVLSTGKKHGDLKIQILRVREAKKEESKLGNRIPQPRGGFRRTYYECKIVDFVGSDRSEDL